MDYSLPGSYVHRILLARRLEWVAILFSRGSFWPRYQTHISCIAGRFFTVWATREALRHLYLPTNSSVQLSHSVMSDSLWPQTLQHARPPCPSSIPRVNSNSCPLNWWCHTTISSSVLPFSSHLQSFAASGSFQMSQFFTSRAKLLEFQL